ncbi:MAG: NADH-quinone oxidoreductase subunit C [Candidatus Aenigmarchaeota archaeon]|nr:NADH-quinone oxidoreductase subunit C [Candidatus Aenigmarchaeota archaeon]
MHVTAYLKRFNPFEEHGNIWIKANRKNLKNILKELKSIGVHRISSITGVDVGKNIEVIYHLIHKHRTINIRVSVDKRKNEIETITDIYPGADLFERELMEMLGLVVKGHPNPKKLFLDEDSPQHPLRR